MADTTPSSTLFGGRLPRLPLPRRVYLLVAGCAVAVLVLGTWIFARWNHVTENDAKVMADMVTISSRVDGWVAARHVTDGDAVEPGAELVTIDQREAGLQVAELKARKASLDTESERLKTQLALTQDTSESAVQAATARHDSAEANLRSLRAELERTALDNDRYQKLVTKDVISRQAWDQSRTTTQQAGERLRQAQAQLAEARANLADALAKRGEVAVLRKQIEQLVHDTAQVEAQIGQKEVDFADRVVRSPIRGVVDQKFVEPGEYVIPAQRLVLLHDPKAVWIEVHLKETKLAGLRPGQHVDVSVDAYPGRRFPGRVARIGNSTTSQFALLPSPNPSGNFTKISQRVPVRIAVDQPEGNPLRPGMMVEVDIDTSRS